MSKGVPLGDKLRKERLIDWFYQEQIMEFRKTMLLVAAAQGAGNLDRFIEDYRQSVLPSEESNLALIEKYEDFLKHEMPSEYTVEYTPKEEFL